MIIDVQRFIAKEESYWKELDELVEALDRDSGKAFDLHRLKRFHYLAERASADLVQIREFVTHAELTLYLESLVSRAFCEIQDRRAHSMRFHPLRWFFKSFPRTFRRHYRGFVLSLAITVVGGLFGAGAVALDPQAKEVIMPWSHLMLDPSDRVAKEEESTDFRLDSKAPFSTYLMTHNTKVSILILALGITWGVGSVMLLFYNGVILGAVIADYMLAGEGMFLSGWLLPHGSVELPAIMIAGQAGLVLAGAMIGWNNRQTLRMRLRAILPDLVTLIGGVACLLVWAGLVESYFSQDHEPVLPYILKISVGLVELILLFGFLGYAGRKKEVDD
ncbi:MAG: stage II sporulation protein M [Pontiellaceae bacterium]|nr:stage II sporulation protein M [Pontiellaceae bacterium]MBN2786011.1 stage II sporulation protein M [Pontiellaceae bacterium]